MTPTSRLPLLGGRPRAGHLGRPLGEGTASGALGGLARPGCLQGLGGAPAGRTSQTARWWPRSLASSIAQREHLPSLLRGLPEAPSGTRRPSFSRPRTMVGTLRSNPGSRRAPGSEPGDAGVPVAHRCWCSTDRTGTGGTQGCASERVAFPNSSERQRRESHERGRPSREQEPVIPTLRAGQDLSDDQRDGDPAASMTWPP